MAPWCTVTLGRSGALIRAHTGSRMRAELPGGPWSR